MLINGQSNCAMRNDAIPKILYIHKTPNDIVPACKYRVRDIIHNININYGKETIFFIGSCPEFVIIWAAI